MNDNEKKLVSALRSGEYKQAQRYLRIGDSYCCLGVACDLYMKEHPEDGCWSDPFKHGIYCYDERNSLLPKRVREWLGWNDDGGLVLNQPRTVFLYELNDGGMDFNRIADIIERDGIAHE